MADDQTVVKGFQVVLQIAPSIPLSDAKFESEMERLMPRLIENGKGVVLGPVFGVNFESRTIEIEFTAVAERHEELHGVLNHALDVLGVEGFEFSGSTTARLKPDEARDDERELVPA